MSFPEEDIREVQKSQGSLWSLPDRAPQGPPTWWWRRSAWALYFLEKALAMINETLNPKPSFQSDGDLHTVLGQSWAE